VQVLAHNNVALRAALVAAESGNTEMLAAALVLFERMPALSRRKILASYCELDRNTKAVKQTSHLPWGRCEAIGTRALSNRRLGSSLRTVGGPHLIPI
jgi:hypothetical protein